MNNSMRFCTISLIFDAVLSHVAMELAKCLILCPMFVLVVLSCLEICTY